MPNPIAHLFLAGLQALSVPVAGHGMTRAAYPPILDMRARAVIENSILKERLETVVPAIMRERGIDMWVLVARENFEDPVVKTMLDAESLAARRRTILIFHDRGPSRGVERLTVSRYGLGGLFSAAWDPARQPDQWARLAEIIRDRSPRRIAINSSRLTAYADGMTLSAWEELGEALGPDLAKRLVRDERLPVRWLETRTPAEMLLYADIGRMAHAIIGEALSSVVIMPGKTTTDDVVWWMRQKVTDLGLQTWFHPSVAISRRGTARPLEGDSVIREGDLIWTDFGITYLRLNTDMQQNAYVLRNGETEAPPGLRAGLRASNRVQDAVTGSFRTGATGNEILASARSRAIAAGLRPTIYSHPIGYHGHGAGPSIGYWDNQAADPRGGLPIHPDTAWSIELNASVKVPEWGGQEVEFKTEEDAFFDGRKVRYIDGHQVDFYLIGPR
ncbi:M24 family metallopeptidase [Sphingomonas montana]|uniref:M24 family metallopeptidase n=1 Tax=Sphingomonas montana TaxID=1843236 RepID=UPI0009FA0213|nr:M24 family metallopeptidase [Sphingomonas montana]